MMFTLMNGVSFPTIKVDYLRITSWSINSLWHGLTSDFQTRDMNFPYMEEVAVPNMYGLIDNDEYFLYMGSWREIQRDWDKQTHTGADRVISSMNKKRKHFSVWIKTVEFKGKRVSMTYEVKTGFDTSLIQYKITVKEKWTSNNTEKTKFW